MRNLGRIKRQNQIRKTIGISLFVLAGLILVSTFIYIDRKLRPTIMVIAEAKALELANRSINSAVADIVKDEIKYEELMNIKTDEEGNITMVQANTILMNKISSDVALEIQNELRQIKTRSANIPIGTALGSPLLAKYGPQIKVSIEPIGNVGVNFGTNFESSGINQTRHRIYLIVKTQVRVVIPLTTSTQEVKSQVPVCETIIVGDVPENYVNIPKENVPDILQDNQN
ncbi:MAG TPA: sporulation protein YunB [Peptostreptococcaceae bacterium]|nr:sporulation protein YunB [Peptostreptococcaceae bacterium]